MAATNKIGEFPKTTGEKEASAILRNRSAGKPRNPRTGPSNGRSLGRPASGATQIRGGQA
jgi:hypothetical protein